MKSIRGSVTLEELFIKKCIIPSRQSRLFFELQSPKKRNTAIGRFSHETDSLLRKESILGKGKTSSIPNGFLSGPIWAIFLYDSGGKEIGDQEAIRMINDAYGPVILLSKIGHAVIKSEEGYFYLLNLN